MQKTQQIKNLNLVTNGGISAVSYIKKRGKNIMKGLF